MIGFPEIKRVVLDLDDILNNFTLASLKLMGADVGPNDYHKYPVEAGFDLLGATHLLTGKHWDLEEFWETIDEKKAWELAGVSKEFWLLDNLSDIVGRENIIIGTSPTKSAACLVGKQKWMEKHLPEWCQRQWAITPRKWFLADSNTLLIDDCDSNCDKFNEFGGHAFLLPRPWNTAHQFTGSTDYIVEALKSIFPTAELEIPQPYIA